MGNLGMIFNQTQAQMSKVYYDIFRIKLLISWLETISP